MFFKTFPSYKMFATVVILRLARMSGPLTVCLFVTSILSGSAFASYHEWMRRIGRIYPTSTEKEQTRKSPRFTGISAYQWEAPQEYNYDFDLGVMYRRTAATDRQQRQCRVCYADKDCFLFSSVRCDYYADTNQILDEQPIQLSSNKNLQLKAEVDSMLFSVIERSRSDTRNHDCIPYVSKYTDCTQDTICSGCKICDCDVYGRWNCSDVQKCRPELVKPIADHKTLLAVIGNLKDVHKKFKYRLKRSLDDINHELDDDRMSHAKLAEWIYGEPTLSVNSVEDTMYVQQQYKNIEPTRTIERNKNDTKLLKYIVNSLIHDTLPEIFKDTSVDYENNRVRRWAGNQTKKENKKSSKITFQELTDWIRQVHPYTFIGNGTHNNTITHGGKKKSDILNKTEKLYVRNDPVLVYSNPDYLAFDDVYNNIAEDNKNYSRRKQLMEVVHKETMDTDFNMYDDKYYYDESTPGTVDPHIRTLVKELGVTVTPELNAVTEEITDFYLQSVTEVVVDLLESAKKTSLNSTHGKEFADLNNKIDTQFLNAEEVNVVNLMKRDVAVTEKISNIANTSKHTNISDALSRLNDDVLTPINKVLKDIQNEIEELSQIRNQLIKFIDDHKDTTFIKTKKNTYLSIYQVELQPHHHEANTFITNNVTLLDQYRAKLKHDIHEIIKDVLTLRKIYSDSSKVPDDLKFLIKALKYYVYRQGFRQKRLQITRRKSYETDTVKAAIIKILELLDRNIPLTDALDPLTPHTKRLLKRVIKRYYVDEFTVTGLRVYDPHYNLTNDLRNIGTKWRQMTNVIQKCSLFDRHYNMKKLHLILASDLARMNDALALVNFARSRRMIPLEQDLADGMIQKINTDLRWMTKGLNQILTINKVPNINLLTVTSQSGILIQHEHKKKDSFFNQIKTLLKNSKKDIMKLVHNKVSKTDIIKEIAKKNLEEMTSKKLQQTMQKWQNNLNIVRRRRSASGFDNLIGRRIKHIIPKYLRGKVSPLALKKKSKKNNSAYNHNKKVSNTTLKMKPTTTKVSQSTLMINNSAQPII